MSLNLAQFKKKKKSVEGLPAKNPLKEQIQSGLCQRLKWFAL
jgi:hypothetical protein